MNEFIQLLKVYSIKVYQKAQIIFIERKYYERKRSNPALEKPSIVLGRFSTEFKELDLAEKSVIYFIFKYQF